MDEKTICRMAEQEGFAAAAVIPTADLVFVPEYRVFCEQNSCGNFGKNYGCPPDCGTPDEMKERVMRHRYAAVFQTRTPAADPMDASAMKILKKRHTQMTWELLKKLEDEGMEQNGFAIMCGPCGICETCRKTEGNPCSFPQRMASCLSAYCIDAGKLAERCGMEMEWNGNVVSFFSMYIFS